MSDLEAILLQALKAVKCPEMVQEFEFAHSRKWRFDFAHPDTKVAVEIDGGEFAKGHHGARRSSDYEKRNFAIVDGWRVFQLTGTMVRKDCALWAEVIKTYIESKSSLYGLAM